MKEKEGWGKEIRQALREILERCRDSVVPMNVPGEGGERPLRWCRKSLLVPLQSAVDAIEDAIRGGASTPEEFAGVLQDLGFPLNAAQ